MIGPWDAEQWWCEDRGLDPSPEPAPPLWIILGLPALTVLVLLVVLL